MPLGIVGELLTLKAETREVDSRDGWGIPDTWALLAIVSKVQGTGA